MFGYYETKNITTKTELLHKIKTVFSSLEFYEDENHEEVNETKEEKAEIVQEEEQDEKEKWEENVEGYVYVFSNPMYEY